MHKKEIFKCIPTSAGILIIALLIQWLVNLSIHALGENRRPACDFIYLDIISNSNSRKDREVGLAVRLKIVQTICEYVQTGKLPAKIDDRFYDKINQLKAPLFSIINKELSSRKVAYTGKIVVTEKRIAIRNKNRIGEETVKVPFLKVHLGAAKENEKWTLLLPPLGYTPGEKEIKIIPQGEKRVIYKLFMRDNH